MGGSESKLEIRTIAKKYCDETNECHYQYQPPKLFHDTELRTQASGFRHAPYLPTWCPTTRWEPQPAAFVHHSTPARMRFDINDGELDFIVNDASQKRHVIVGDVLTIKYDFWGFRTIFCHGHKCAEVDMRWVQVKMLGVTAAILLCLII